MKKTMIIISNDRVFDVPPFYKEVYDGYHYMLISEFFKHYNLPYEINEHNDEYIKRKLLEAGFIIVETVSDDTAICWFNLPVTDKQLEALKGYKEYLSSFPWFEARTYPTDKYYFYKMPNKENIIEKFLNTIEDEYTERGRK